ncbi:PilW family protein [Dyella jejuensis]|uniref:PilW family protein n=1 Tax=Dyella jejuensis TaxID=1432009 RepID=A0ABW8JDD1_9GAMM
MNGRRQYGLSLVELLIAMVIGLLVSAGIIGVFIATSKAERAQAQWARLQEEGRYAITQIKHDLAMSGAQYCTNTGGDVHASASGLYLDAWRAPTVYASDPGVLMSALNDVTTPWGHAYPPPNRPYSWPSFLVMRGYDCTVELCTPMDPSNKRDANGFGIPAMGTAVDDRVVGASVITVRYLDPASGWTIATEEGEPGSTLERHADGSLSIALKPQPGEPDNFDLGDPLAMLADCSNAQIFAVSGQKTSVLVSTGNNFIQPDVFQHGAAPRLFDLSRDMQTVTYFLKVVDNGDGMGHTTGALVRRVNGGDTRLRKGSSEEIARGVERLDFRYGVQRADGTLRYYTAAQVDDSTRADCTSVPLPIPGSDDRGCLWRSVSLIEVSLLMDGQEPLYTLSPDELAYAYTVDQATGGASSVQAPNAPNRHVTPLQQGFPLALLRREFSAVVAVRNVNP